ncbi:MAG: hypothetical protein F2785_04285 [Actinobacteria bacterium]|uniref:Unannotated protein n=1 Tax=freshwater metagenome TaxID=449393 RepID=A0A6J7DF36_9ZZZZ|nr:hypothetical protein [Actinomycetota bacterium]
MKNGDFAQYWGVGKDSMRLRLTIALVIQIIAILFSLRGWIDALEGGIAVVIVLLLTVAARLVGRVAIPKLTSISLTAATVCSIATVSLLVYAYDPLASDSQFAESPFSSTISGLNIAFRVTAVAVIAGTVFYAIRILDERKKSARS